MGKQSKRRRVARVGRRAPARGPAQPDPASMASLAQAPLAALPVHNWVRAELVAPPKSPAPPPSPPSPPPPATLVLSGELTDQGACLGVYSLLEDVQSHGAPVWRHTSRDRCIAHYENGTWLVQQAKNVGRNDNCHMRFSDPSVVFPHLSALPWEEFDSDAHIWIRAHVFQCVDDPSGEIAALYLKREMQAERERQAARQRAQQLKPAGQNAKSFTQPKKKMCRDCLTDPLKGGSRCFVCDPH